MVKDLVSPKLLFRPAELKINRLVESLFFLCYNKNTRKLETGEGKEEGNKEI
jgi:hypothetical protein